MANPASRQQPMDDERTCSKCGSARTRVIGQSVSPPVFYIKCSDCGHSTAVIPSGSSTPRADMDRRRVERLVRSIIADADLPFEVVGVADAMEGWQVIVRTDSRRIVRVHAAPGAPSAMRAALKRALEDAR